MLTSPPDILRVPGVVRTPGLTLFCDHCSGAHSRIPDKSVNLILTDPPYGTTDVKRDRPLDLEDLWEDYQRILAPGGVVVMFGAQPYTSELVQSNRKWFKHCLVWDKNKCGSPGLARIRHMITHEDVIVFAPGRSTYNPQFSEGKPYARSTSKPEGYVGDVNRHGYGLKPRTSFVNHGTRYPKSILRFSREFSAQQQIHGHQKPLALGEYLIKTFSNPGGVVLDSAMGCGTFPWAMLRTGRRGYGIELGPEVFASALYRIFPEIVKELGLPDLTPKEVGKMEGLVVADPAWEYCHG